MTYVLPGADPCINNKAATDKLQFLGILVVSLLCVVCDAGGNRFWYSL